MLYILFILLILLLFSLRPIHDGYNEQYIDRETTLTINGFFISTVFVSHFSQYVEVISKADKIFHYIHILVTQLIVTPFLFYSGYGIMYSILHRGTPYLESMPLKRILKTILLFDIAILFYAALNLFLGVKMQLSQVLLSMIGWSNLGNSNWYIMTITCVYILTWLGFMICRDNKLLGLIISTVFIFLYVFVISRFKETRFYNTTLCYTAGLWFSYFKKDIDYFVRKGHIYLYTFLFSLLLFIITWFRTIASKMVLSGHQRFSVFVDPYMNYHQLMYLSFITVIVLLTMRFKVNNRFFNWCGKNLLPIFILQRLPMIILGKFSWMEAHPIIYFFGCVMICYFLTIFYNNIILSKINILFSKEKI